MLNPRNGGCVAPAWRLSQRLGLLRCLAVGLPAGGVGWVGVLLAVDGSLA